jgi:hypothetical protein
LQDSIDVGDISIVNHHNLDYPAGSNVITTVFDRSIFDELPTKADTAITEGGITKTKVSTHFFVYDSKQRLVTVGQQTDFVLGDHEYDLTITYDDRDNAIALSYEFTTGPRSKVTIAATGYDDNPNPFTAIEHWYHLMHAGWDNYDPEPIFTALSKNNLLGFTLPNGVKREVTYAYNGHGYPIQRTQTNINGADRYSFDETFVYQCP